MIPPRYAYLTNAELLRAAQDPMIETLDREALMDLVVELTAALEDTLDLNNSSRRRRRNSGGPNHIRPINPNQENTCSN